MSLSENKLPMAKIWLALSAVYVIWGSTYLAIRFAIETLPPFGMAGVRFLVAGAILFWIARAQGAPLPTKPQLRASAIIGTLLLLGGNGCVVWAEQYVDSSIAALLVATEPVWVILLVWMRPGGRRPQAMVFGGLALSLLGMFLLVRPSGGETLDPLGVVALTLGTISWATGSVYAARAPLPASPLLATALQMLFGGTLFMILSGAMGEFSRFDPSAVSLRSAGALLYLIVFGALIAYTAYSWLIRVAPPVLASTYAYVNPVVAVILGWALAGEQLTVGMLGAAAIILTGVTLLTVSSAKTPEGPAPKTVLGEEPLEACG